VLNLQENGYVTMVVRVVGDNDSVYQTSVTDKATNDAKYHSVRLTRRVNNVTLEVDNPLSRHLTGRHQGWKKPRFLEEEKVFRF